MALAKRRGFIYQASEIYGGQSGFWDYGPLGAQLKKNLRDAWWEDMVLNPCGGEPGPNGEPVRIVPPSIIQNPRVWEASGHIAGFSDPMVDCRETKQRYRFDHLMLYVPVSGERNGKPLFAFMPDTASEHKQKKKPRRPSVKRAPCRCRSCRTATGATWWPPMRKKWAPSPSRAPST